MIKAGDPDTTVAWHQDYDSVNDQVCYFGSDPGMPVLVPAGSVVVFSSTVIHRSGLGFLRADRARRRDGLRTAACSDAVLT